MTTEQITAAALAAGTASFDDVAPGVASQDLINIRALAITSATGETSTVAGNDEQGRAIGQLIELCKQVTDNQADACVLAMRATKWAIKYAEVNA